MVLYVTNGEVRALLSFDWSDLTVAVGFVIYIILRESLSAAWKKKVKAFLATVHEAWKDNKLTDEEWNRIMNKFIDLFRRV